MPHDLGFLGALSWGPDLSGAFYPRLENFLHLLLVKLILVINLSRKSRVSASCRISLPERRPALCAPPQCSAGSLALAGEPRAR